MNEESAGCNKIMHVLHLEDNSGQGGLGAKPPEARDTFTSQKLYSINFFLQFFKNLGGARAHPAPRDLRPC